MCNWAPEKYVIIVILNALSLTCMELTAELCAVISAQAPIGILAFLGQWFANFLFSGMLVKDKDVVWPLRIICYILPYRYGVLPMIYEEYIDSTFEGTTPCTVSTHSLCYHGSYTCDTLACYGKTGAQVLDSLNLIFGSISSESKTVMHILYMLIYCVCIKGLYIMRILWIVKYKN